MAKVKLSQLKEMIQQAVREQIEEQISGLPGAGTQRKGYATGGSPGRAQAAQAGENPWMQANMNLDQLVAAMKSEQDPAQKGLIKQAVQAKLKAAGW